MQKNHSYFLSILLIFNMVNTITANHNKAEETATIQNYSDRLLININNLDALANMFPKSVKEIQDWTQAAITLAKNDIQSVLETTEPTFNNTMQIIDHMSGKFRAICALMETLGLVHPDDEFRDAALMALTTLQEAAVDLSMNVELYHCIQNYYDIHASSEHLSESDILLITDYLESCKKAGLHLPEATQNHIKILKKQIFVLEQEFSININNDDSHITATAEELTGVNKEFLKSLSKENHLYVIPCQRTSYISILTECSVAETRKKMFFAFNNRAYPENEKIFIELLQKRHELAILLGHENFTSLDLEDTTAKTLTSVEQFLLPIADQCLQKGLREWQELQQELPKDITLQENNTFYPWDYPYIYNEYIKHNFSIDESNIAEYLPLQKVIDGICTIYQEFLGLTFTQIEPLWKWHEDVLLLEIHQTSSQQLLGYLFLDLYPRPNKYSHACAAPILISYEQAGENCTSVASLICNFPKPTDENPSLLKYDDVVVFFHEFGHAMHNVLSRTKHASHAGLNVANDFVEVPSQMFEQWMFEPHMLELVSEHYQTGEKLPKEIINNKIALRKSNSGYTILRQCLLGLFSLYTMNNNELSYNPSELWKSLHHKFLSPFFTYEDNNHWYTTFGHLAHSGYAAKYYSYLWTEVFALDLFTMIKEHNFDTSSREKVITLLSAGGSVEPETLLENFLGRKPSQQAFLEALGLTT